MSGASPTTTVSSGVIVISRQYSFKDRLQTLRVQEAVVHGGQHILLLVFTTLFLGDLSDIKGFIRQKLGSNRQFKDSFTAPEQKKLEGGDYKKWDISLIYKLLQKVCGLSEKVSEWKSFARDKLEKLLDELKDLRNDMAHTHGIFLTEKERDEKLEALRDLCFEILTKLNEKAQIGDETVQLHYDAIEDLLSDVKKPINESSNPALQTDSSASAAGISSNAISSAASPIYGFGSSPASPPIFGSASACAPASAGYPESKSAFAAAASANAAIVGGFSPLPIAQVNYDHDSVEAMDVDDRYEATSGEKSIINQLVKSFWEFAGPGFIAV